MSAKRSVLVLFFFCAVACCRAQDMSVIEKYIATYKDLAIAEMQRTGVPASIKLAQGIHETMAGTSVLVNKSNNHFGIKCKTGWKGESVSHDDDARGECFRKYPQAQDSYRDHSDFLKNSQRYAFLFSLDPMDYKGWAYGLKRAGYATNPKYPVIIIKLVEDYHLQDYTLIALGKMPGTDAPLVAKQETIHEDAVVPVAAALTVEETKPAADYPTGEFRINETKVVYATKGTSYLGIAQQYNVPLKRLFEFNDDLPEADVVEEDQLVFLQRKRKTGNNEFHIVQPGETIYDIAQTEAIRLESLLEYNFLNESQDPAAGEKLYLRSKAPAAPRLATNAVAAAPATVSASQALSKSNMLTHVVQPKETLYAISKKYNVKMEDITEWNQLGLSGIKTGQTLKIYK